MSDCDESVLLCRRWSALAGAFLQQGIGLAQMREDPEYHAAYQAYFTHQMTCPVCSAKRKALAEAVKNNPVKPVPAFVMTEEL